MSGRLAAAAAALALALAACGSQLDPDTVARVNGTGPGAQPGVVASGPDQVVGEDLPGSDGAEAPPADQVRDPGSASGSGDSPPTPDDGDAAPQGHGDNAPDGGAAAGSCDGFENQTGISAETITIGNVADVSGPVPGVFEASQDAVRAYVAYFNATSDICGRSLALKTYDSRTDGGAEQQAYASGCDDVFAMIGSMSAFDSSGADTTAACGLPDLRAAAVTTERNACATCFGALSSNPAEFQNAVPDFVLEHFPDAAQHAAMLYLNVGAAVENGQNQARAMSKRGMHFDLVQGIDISEFNYAPYVQQMKDKGIGYVQMIGGSPQMVRLAQAMQQQGFEPDVYMIDPTVYNPEYVASGGSAVEGTVVFLNVTPFEEESGNEELRLYTSWLQQVKPGATPTFFGIYAWSTAGPPTTCTPRSGSGRSGSATASAS